jgi:hypothetical protein
MVRPADERRRVADAALGKLESDVRAFLDAVSLRDICEGGAPLSPRVPVSPASVAAAE